MRNLKIALAVLLLAAVTAFTIQNAEAVEYRFLGWDVTLRRSMVVLIAVLTGIVIGWLLGAARHRAR